jgi:hypothetical protein
MCGVGVEADGLADDVVQALAREPAGVLQRFGGGPQALLGGVRGAPDARELGL